MTKTVIIVTVTSETLSIARVGSTCMRQLSVQIVNDNELNHGCIDEEHADKVP